MPRQGGRQARSQSLAIAAAKAADAKNAEEARRAAAAEDVKKQNYLLAVARSLNLNARTCPDGGRCADHRGDTADLGVVYELLKKDVSGDLLTAARR